MVSKSLLLPTVPISAHHKLGTSTHSQPPNSSTTLYTNGTASAPSQSPPPASPSSATSPPPSPPEPTPPHPQPTPPYRSHQNLRRRLPRHRREVHSLHWRARRTILPRNRRPPLRRRSHLVLRLLPHSRRPPCRPSPSLMGRVVRECRSERLRCYVCERAIRHRNQYSLPHRPNQRLARLPYRVLCGRHVQRTLSTTYGENVFVVGSVTQLGSWDPANTVPLQANGYSSAYPLWSVTVALPAGTTFQYKYLKKEVGGGAVWESDPNRQFTVPRSCATTTTENDVWR